MTLAIPVSSSRSSWSSACAGERSKPRASRSGDSSSKSQRGRRGVGSSATAHAFTTWLDSVVGLAVGCPGTEMPYSTSVPMTRRTLMQQPYASAPGEVVERPCGRVPRRACARGTLQQGPFSQVLAGVRRRVDRAPGLVALAADERADVDDPLALLARDPRPVVGVGGVRQVLVLLELVQARRHQVAHPQPAGPGLQLLLDRHLLRPVDDVLQHGAGVEVLEVQDLLVTVGVGDLEEAVLLALGVHALDGALDHPGDRRLAAAAVLGQVLGSDRQRRPQVLAEDVAGGLGVGPLNLDLHVQPARPQDRRVDHILAVGGTDDDDVLQALDPVDLTEQLWDDRALDVGGDPRPAGAEDRVHLVEEDDDRRPLAGLLPGPLEHQAMCRSVAPTYLFGSSGPLMFRKYERPEFVPTSPRTAATFFASELATALAISVLPQPGGP